MLYIWYLKSYNNQFSMKTVTSWTVWNNIEITKFINIMIFFWISIKSITNTFFSQIFEINHPVLYACIEEYYYYTSVQHSFFPKLLIWEIDIFISSTYLVGAGKNYYKFLIIWWFDEVRLLQSLEPTWLPAGPRVAGRILNQ